jgi:hypothetical protein
MLELKQILIKNDYPIEVIDSEIYKFKKRKQKATQIQPPENNQSINQSIQIINDDQQQLITEIKLNKLPLTITIKSTKKVKTSMTTHSSFHCPT